MIHLLNSAYFHKKHAIIRLKDRFANIFISSFDKFWIISVFWKAAIQTWNTTPRLNDFVCFFELELSFRLFLISYYYLNHYLKQYLLSVSDGASYNINHAYVFRTLRTFELFDNIDYGNLRLDKIGHVGNWFGETYQLSG